MKHKFAYKWTMKDADFTKDKGKVFSCFACGGGSTMGYKLAGFDVVGCNEIDPRMNSIYVNNHHPKHNYLCDIRELVKMDLPEELYNLDILDGSPPCSSFSTAGARSDDWGKEKKFREGQVSQVLDTLFFDFISLAERLKPKVVVAENVKGLMLGEAKEYMRNIIDGFGKAGYYTRYFLLNGRKMGLPQKRERVFFVCLRKDLAGKFLVPDGLFDENVEIDMCFNEEDCNVGEFVDFNGDTIKDGKLRILWDNRKFGDRTQKDANERLYGKPANFGQSYVYLDTPAPTLTAKKEALMHFYRPVYTSVQECCCISSFPQDYNFGKEQPWYVCGMSVPPVMMANVASNIYEQWLSKL